jgi:transposase InsO family protein
MPSETPWEERSLSPNRKLRGWKKIRKYAVQRHAEGQAVAVVCRVLAVSRSWFYKWWTRWLKAGRAFDSLDERPSTPLTVHLRREESREKVVETRRAYPTWGARKIKAYLDSECEVSHQTVHEILVDEELVQRGPKARRVWKSWARRHGNSLWQMDFKQLTQDGWWLFTLIDDHSRFILASRVFHHTPTTKDTIDVVLRTVRFWGKPRQILTDRGTQFWSHHGPGEFTNTLAENGILHIKAARQKPTTTGKIERWHRTLGEEFLAYCTNRQAIEAGLGKYLETYNTRRPHESINYETPLTRYLGSLIREESL